MADKPSTPKDRPPRPDSGTPWRHQAGCSNPDATDWSCPCGPVVIAEAPKD